MQRPSSEALARPSLFTKRFSNRFLPWLWLLFFLFANLWKGDVKALTLPTPPGKVQTLGVEISGLHQDYRRHGLDPTKLTERVRQQLEEAGFTVIPAEEARLSPPAALLQIKFSLVRAYFGYPYSITVKLVQKIRLADPQNGLIPLVTWSNSQRGVVRLAEIARLNDYTTTVVAQFITSTQSSPRLAP